MSGPRHAAGGVPTSRLNARANAASDSYPTSSATDATVALVLRNNDEAT